MIRSFSLVDNKLAEADFFLGRIATCGYDFFAVRCYVAAFASSARSVTFALQSGLQGVESVDTWYKARQTELRNDPLALFFHEFRRVNQHTGDNFVSAGTTGPRTHVQYLFMPTPEIPNVPTDDVETCCVSYMTKITCVVYDCYLEFGPHIDACQRYTSGYFASIRKTVEDAEDELGFPRGWTDIGDPAAVEYRWQSLRDSATGCEIDHLFEKYLGKTTPTPQRPPAYESDRYR